MEILDQCPCGAFPKKLCITTTAQGRKWSTVAGDCCDQWTIDFCSEGLTLTETEVRANTVWNTAPRLWKRKKNG